MFQNYSKVLKIGAIAVGFLVTGCGFGQEEVDPIAQALIDIEFTDSESGDPVVDAPVEVSAIFSGETEAVPQGEVPTGINGEIEGAISNPEEVAISQLIFVITVDDQEYTFEEDVNLELRTQEPFDSVEFSFQVDTASDE